MPIAISNRFSPIAPEAFADGAPVFHQQENHFSQLIESLPSGVIVLDGEGTVTTANDVARQLLDEPLEGESWRHIILRAFRPRSDDYHEVSLHNGRRVKVEISPLRGKPGQLIVLTDLTETRELQDKLSHMQRLSSLGKMVASLAHQVRTPLSAALLYASNLGNKTLPEQNREDFQQKLLSRLHELEKQVNDMLLFSRSDKMEDVSHFSLKDLLSSVEAHAEGLLNKTRIQLEIENPYPDTVLTGNLSALSSAISNLVHNSLCHCPDDSLIRISCSVDTFGLEIDYQDTGPGIPEHLIEKIFEPFFTTRQQGTGLGLAVVKSVINSHKGDIHAVQSRQGVHFKIQLPCTETCADITPLFRHA